MKIVAIMGNIRKNSQTKIIMEIVRKQLNQYKNVEFEYIDLRDLNIQLCRGCAVCIEKGEDYCPLKDDHQLVLRKIEAADGVIFATPNYALHVTHLLKNYFDRSAYILHRPAFFGKVFTSVVTQGAYGGKTINKYLDNISMMMGGVVVKGCTITIPDGAAFNNDVWTHKEIIRVENQIQPLVKKIIQKLNRDRYPRPTLLKLMIFRFSRASHKNSNHENKDIQYFKERGWFESKYYYDTKLNIFQSWIGKLIDLYQKKKNKTNSYS